MENRGRILGLSCQMYGITRMLEGVERVERDERSMGGEGGEVCRWRRKGGLRDCGWLERENGFT